MKYRHILGLDLSLASTGVVLLRIVDRQPTVLHVETIKTEAGDVMVNRQSKVLLEIIGIVNRFGLRYEDTGIVIEDYGSSKIRGKLYERVELTGMVKFCLTVFHGFNVYAATPGAVKRFMGAVTTKKGAMKDALAATFGFTGHNEHVRDAYALCRYLIAYFLGMNLTISCSPAQMHVKERLQLTANNQGRLRVIPLTSLSRRPNLPIRNKQTPP